MRLLPVRIILHGANAREELLKWRLHDMFLIKLITGVIINKKLSFKYCIETEKTWETRQNYHKSTTDQIFFILSLVGYVSVPIVKHCVSMACILFYLFLPSDAIKRFLFCAFKTGKETESREAESFDAPKLPRLYISDYTCKFKSEVLRSHSSA